MKKQEKIRHRKPLPMLAAIAIIVAGAIIATIMIGANQDANGEKALALGLSHIEEGNYGEGLSACHTIPAGSGICYAAALGRKVSEGEDVTIEFCESMPLDDARGLLLSKRYKMEYNHKMTELKRECFMLIS